MLFFDPSEKAKPQFKICSYIQKMTPNLTTAPKTSIYNTKHSQHIKLNFPESNFFNESNFTKIRHPSKSAFSTDLDGPPLVDLKF